MIRYNWIESGNRQLDLVDSDYNEFIDSSSYNTTFVCGNILIEPDDAGNSQIIHYGGDSGEKEGIDIGALEYAGLSGVNRKCMKNGFVADYKNDKCFVLVNRTRSVKYDETVFSLNGRALQLNVPRNGVRAGVVLGRRQKTEKTPAPKLTIFSLTLRIQFY